jgi:hypothetical protein
MARNAIRFWSVALAAALIAACGGGGNNRSAPNPMPTSQTGTATMIVTDASSEDWATIGVKVLSNAPVPQGGGGNVAVYTAPTTVPLINLYGDVTSIASDNASIMVTKEFPAEPAGSPETAVATTPSLRILVDSTNGTIFYDVDARSHSLIRDFTSESNLAGKSVRIAARYQEDGTLVAIRIWASSQLQGSG